MDTALRLMALLPLADWLALAWFFVAWIGYALFARRRGAKVGSLLSITNRIRRRWMRQTTLRDNRVVDGVVVQNLSTSPSFFASTTIFIIGGLVAALAAGDKASELVRDLPFAARTSALVFDMKLLLLTGIFVHAFFRFTWSMRQYSFGALLVAAAPEPEEFRGNEAARDAFADEAGAVVGLAAETFNDGLRAYYMSFAAILWFLSPLAFALGSAGVVYVLYEREFRSDVLALLKQPRD